MGTVASSRPQTPARKSHASEGGRGGRSGEQHACRRGIAADLSCRPPSSIGWRTTSLDRAVWLPSLATARMPPSMEVWMTRPTITLGHGWMRARFAVDGRRRSNRVSPSCAVDLYAKCAEQCGRCDSSSTGNYQPSWVEPWFKA
jgi:hypothetical protein